MSSRRSWGGEERVREEEATPQHVGMHTHSHEVKLLLQNSVDLLPGGVWVVEREGIQQQDSCVGTDVSISHLKRKEEEGRGGGEVRGKLRQLPVGRYLEGAPEERVVQSQQHLRDTLLLPLLVDIAQHLREREGGREGRRKGR